MEAQRNVKVTQNHSEEVGFCVAVGGNTVVGGLGAQHSAIDAGEQGRWDSGANHREDE